MDLGRAWQGKPAAGSGFTWTIGPCPFRVCCCDSMLAQGGFLLSGTLSPAGMSLCHADVIISLTCPPTSHGCAEPKDVPEEALTQPMRRASITHLEPWARRACFQKQSLTLREEVCICIVYVHVHVYVRDLYVDVCNVSLHICV